MFEIFKNLSVSFSATKKTKTDRLLESALHRKAIEKKATLKVPKRRALITSYKDANFL